MKVWMFTSSPYRRRSFSQKAILSSTYSIEKKKSEISKKIEQNRYTRELFLMLELFLCIQIEWILETVGYKNWQLKEDATFAMRN